MLSTSAPAAKPWLVQHLGEAHFAAGHYDHAVFCFERALRFRSASGAYPSLLASSRMALGEARRRVGVTQARDSKPSGSRDAASDTNAQ